MYKLLNFLVPGFLLIPFIAFAQRGTREGFGELNEFVQDGTGFIDGILIPVLLAIAFLVFIVGIVQYFFFTKGDDASANRSKGKQLMIWGILAFVVIVSIWGIVELISDGLNFQNNEELQNIPKTPSN